MPVLRLPRMTAETALVAGVGTHRRTCPVVELRLGHNGAGAWNVTLAGELDALTSAALLGAANAIPQEAPVEINAADLTFCDSAGLRVLIQLAESRRVKPVTLRDPCLTLALLLRYVSVDGVLDVRPSQELSAATN